MIDVIGTVLVGSALAAILTAVVTTMPLPLSGRLLMAGIAGAWIGLAGAIAGAGALSNPPMLLALSGAPLMTTVVLVLAVPAARHALGTIPLPVLAGLNVFRLGGVLFVLLAFAGRLSGPFPYIAGWGDFITGALAFPVLWLAAGENRFRGRLVVAWNTFGMLDLIVAVGLALISRNGSPLQLIHAGVGTAAMQTLPWAFVPTVLVPIFFIAHAIIFVRMRAGSLDEPARQLIATGELGHAL